MTPKAEIERSKPVDDTFGQIGSEGAVDALAIGRHPATATAWSHEADTGGGRRSVAVLGISPVCPMPDVVWAAAVAESNERKS